MNHPPLSWVDENYSIEQDYENCYDAGEEEDR